MPSAIGSCSGPATVSVTNGIQAEAPISAQILTTGRVQIDGTTTMSTQVDAGCFASSGAVTLNRATLTAKDTM